MKEISKADLLKMNKLDRLNLVNSISGIKPANLIGTRSLSGNENLAIFSSIVHLSSNPALLGFMMRPSSTVRRDTYENILETGFYTINQVSLAMAKRGHYTSAKFKSEVSEFEACHLRSEFKNQFTAPFVAESNLKIAMRFLEEIDIKINSTKMIIGQIEHIYIKDDLWNSNSLLNLERLEAAGISGLNQYYSLKKAFEFPYARVEELPDFIGLKQSNE